MFFPPRSPSAALIYTVLQRLGGRGFPVPSYHFDLGDLQHEFVLQYVANDHVLALLKHAFNFLKDKPHRKGKKGTSPELAVINSVRQG